MFITNARFLLIAVLGLGACGGGPKATSATTATSEAKASSAVEATTAAPGPAQAESRETVETVEIVEPAPAPATKPRLAIVVEGSRSGAVRKDIEKMLGEHYDVISTDSYQKTAKRLKAKKMKDRHVAKVAAKLEADAVLHVVLGRKSRKGYKLALHLLKGSTGKTVETFNLILKGQRLDSSDQRQLADKLMAQLNELAPAAVPVPAEVPAEEPVQAITRSSTDNQTRVTKQSSDSSTKKKRGRLSTVKHDHRGQVIDDEVPKTAPR
jgi:hypothetical protein